MIVLNVLANRLPLMPLGALLSSGSLHSHGSQGGSGTLAQSVVGGLIGGGTVLLGVLCAEYVTRKRERANRFDDAFWNLQERAGAMFRAIDTAPSEFASLPFLVDIGRLRSEARPPLPNAKPIANEINEIIRRYYAALDAWGAGGPPPNVSAIIGDEIARLSKRSEHWWNV